MRAESNIKPTARYEVNRLANGMGEVVFYENEEQIADDDTVRYVYDTYAITVSDRETLEADIEENFSAWLLYAKESENISKPVSPEERLAKLEAENAELRKENAITANALDELICSILGGEE